MKQTCNRLKLDKQHGQQEEVFDLGCIILCYSARAESSICHPHSISEHGAKWLAEQYVTDEKKRKLHCQAS